MITRDKSRRKFTSRFDISRVREYHAFLSAFPLFATILDVFLCQVTRGGERSCALYVTGQARACKLMAYLKI
jgi:hypothetical protein